MPITDPPQVPDLPLSMFGSAISLEIARRRARNLRFDQKKKNVRAGRSV
jgi:hypothetical protein